MNHVSHIRGHLALKCLIYCIDHLLNKELYTDHVMTYHKIGCMEYELKRAEQSISAFHSK